jgi:hypothetical protein
MQAQQQKDGHVPFVVPTNNALHSAQPLAFAIAVLAICAAGFAFS